VNVKEFGFTRTFQTMEMIHPFEGKKRLKWNFPFPPTYIYIYIDTHTHTRYVRVGGFYVFSMFFRGPLNSSHAFSSICPALFGDGNNKNKIQINRSNRRVTDESFFIISPSIRSIRRQTKKVGARLNFVTVSQKMYTIYFIFIISRNILS